MHAMHVFVNIVVQKLNIGNKSLIRVKLNAIKYCIKITKQTNLGCSQHKKELTI